MQVQNVKLSTEDFREQRLTCEQIKAIVLKANKFEDFNPMQKLVLKKNWAEKNLVLSAPTASGKTIIAELCALNCIINRRQKVLYTTPLKALASEHYKDWKKKYADLKIKIAISTGDFDSSSHYLSNYDLIFTTNEKLDSLITHRADWLSNIGLLIVDEIHELSTSRGATLEAVVVKMRYLMPKIQILALSATIPNAKEIASWLNAELIVSTYRPVKLLEGVLLGSRIYFENETLELSGDDVAAVVDDTLAMNKQAIFFMLTRKKAEQLAQKLAPFIEQKLLPKEKLFLKKLAEKLENVLETPTEQCKMLASLAARGIAFHHAGLMQKQRELIEDAFREGKLKVVVATPTLAMGINMPAFRVVIPSLYRYTELGMQQISVAEYKQMAGRSGRPKFDSSGQALLFARSEEEKEKLFDSYIHGVPEEVESMLAHEQVLRTQLLALIASQLVFDLKSLEKFFEKSFYFKQYGNISALNKKISKLIDELAEYGFIIIEDEKLNATPLGKRVAELYLDPVSAHNMLGHLRQKPTELAALYCLVDTTEFSPWPAITKAKREELFHELLARQEELRIDAMRAYFMDEYVVDKFNAALMLEEWINEVSEQAIMESYNMQPGILYSKLLICDWLSYAASELAKLLGADENASKMPSLEEQSSVPQDYKKTAVFFQILRKRLKYGVKEELLELVELRGIGRVRARRLYRAGIKTIADVKKTNIADLERILGKKVAESIKAQLHA